MMYRQCNLVHDNGSHTVSWLDSSIAKPGVRVSLKGENGERLGPFTVTRTYNPELPEQTVKDRERDWKKTRKASDI